jgi:hypothetical protein
VIRVVSLERHAPISAAIWRIRMHISIDVYTVASQNFPSQPGQRVPTVHLGGVVVFIAHSLQSLMNKRQIVPLTVLILLPRNKVRLLVAGRTCNDLSVVNSSCVRSRPWSIVHYESVSVRQLEF